jgi:hypothetical protein
VGWTFRKENAWESGWWLIEDDQVDGKEKVMYAMTKIKGVGRRYSNLVCKKADVDLNKRYISTGFPAYIQVDASDAQSTNTSSSAPAS